MNGVELIAEERQRQIDVEGWTPEHDDGHLFDVLALAASCYAMPAGCRVIQGGASHMNSVLSLLWPFEKSAWKPRPGNRVKELVIAGALIAAEIDRLQRKDAA
jgi:hypothetical protein